MAKRVIAYERHHRKPRSIGGTNEQRNISLIDSVHHSAWHTLFQNKQAEEIAQIINDTLIDPDYILIPIFVGKTLTREQLHSIIRKIQKAL